MPKVSNNSRYFVIAAVIIGLDQISKWMILEHFVYTERLNLIPNCFDLILVYNTGAAFSFLAEASGWQKYFFTILAFAVCTYLSLGIVKNQFMSMGKIAAAFIIGGALGNVADRLIHGHVVDWLLVYYQSWSYPAFNLADSFICVGAVLLLWDGFKTGQAQKNQRVKNKKTA